MKSKNLLNVGGLFLVLIIMSLGFSSCNEDEADNQNSAKKPTPNITCLGETILKEGKCVLPVVCADGEGVESGSCVKTCSAGKVIVEGECKSIESACAEGEVIEDGKCAAALDCKADTDCNEGQECGANGKCVMKGEQVCGAPGTQQCKVAGDGIVELDAFNMLPRFPLQMVALAPDHYKQLKTTINEPYALQYDQPNGLKGDEMTNGKLFLMVFNEDDTEYETPIAIIPATVITKLPQHVLANGYTHIPANVIGGTATVNFEFHGVPREGKHNGIIFLDTQYSMETLKKGCNPATAKKTDDCLSEFDVLPLGDVSKASSSIQMAAAGFLPKDQLPPELSDPAVYEKAMASTNPDPTIIPIEFAGDSKSVTIPSLVFGHIILDKSGDKNETSCEKDEDCKSLDGQPNKCDFYICQDNKCVADDPQNHVGCGIGSPTCVEDGCPAGQTCDSKTGTCTKQDGGPDPKPCKSTADCGTGYNCNISGLCMKDSGSDSKKCPKDITCAKGETCNSSGACVKDTTQPPAGGKCPAGIQMKCDKLNQVCVTDMSAVGGKCVDSNTTKSTWKANFDKRMQGLQSFFTASCEQAPDYKKFMTDEGYYKPETSKTAANDYCTENKATGTELTACINKFTTQYDLLINNTCKGGGATCSQNSECKSNNCGNGNCIASLALCPSGQFKDTTGQCSCPAGKVFDKNNNCVLKSSLETGLSTAQQGEIGFTALLGAISYDCKAPGTDGKIATFAGLSETTCSNAKFPAASKTACLEIFKKAWNDSLAAKAKDPKTYDCTQVKTGAGASDPAKEQAVADAVTKTNKLKTEIDAAQKTAAEEAAKVQESIKKGSIKNAIDGVNASMKYCTDEAALLAKYPSYIKDVAKYCDTAKGKAEYLNTQITEATKYLKTANETVQSKINEINAVTKSVNDAVNNASQEIQNKINQVNAQIKAVQDQINSVQTQIKDTVTAVNNQVKAVQDQITNIQKTVQDQISNVKNQAESVVKQATDSWNGFKDSVNNVTHVFDGWGF